MAAAAFQFAVYSSLLLAAYSDAVAPSELRCERAIQHEVRVSGCQQQPCTIRKGVRLPFEVDFTFTGPPVQADEFDFKVWIGFYGYSGPTYYGHNLSNYTCKNGQCGMLYPNQKYTFKNSLWVHPNSTCVAGCDEMNQDGTGKRRTKWSYFLTDSRSNGTDAGCEFIVKLNITN